MQKQKNILKNEVKDIEYLHTLTKSVYFETWPFRTWAKPPAACNQAISSFHKLFGTNLP
jgi:hypothetical protein